MNGAGGPDPIIFSTDGLPVADRLEAWNAAFGSLNSISASFGEIAENVRCENWLLGQGMVLSSTRVVRSSFVRDHVRSRRNQIDHWVLRVLRRGRGHLRHANFEVTTSPGDLVVFSMHETWSVDWEDAEWVSLCFPRDLDLRLSTGLAALGPGLLRGPGPGLLADFMLALPARLSQAAAEDIPVLAEAVHGTISACLLTGATPQPGLLPGDAAAGLTRERVRRAILREISSEELKPAILARKTGLSRSSLYRLFENDGGVARYIKDVRLAMAHDALRDPVMAGRTISVIAKAHGFSEPTDFSRAFRSAYGLSPREARTGLSPRTPLTLGNRPHRGRAAKDLAARLYLP